VRCIRRRLRTPYLGRNVGSCERGASGEASVSAGCSITGGAFYDPATAMLPSQYQGDYFYADYCSGWIRSFDPNSETDALFATGIVKPVDIEVGDSGILDYLFRGSSSVPAAVQQISYTG
jgi:hypothetical protein